MLDEDGRISERGGRKEVIGIYINGTPVEIICGCHGNNDEPSDGLCRRRAVQRLRGRVRVEEGDEERRKRGR